MRAYGQNEFNTAGDLVDTFNRGGDILRLRAYIKGVGDGLQFSNAELAHEKRPLLYCPPPDLPVVDAQYVAIMENYLTNHPKLRDSPPPTVLLIALMDVFPCK
jgi:hypothetical protein